MAQGCQLLYNAAWLLRKSQHECTLNMKQQAKEQIKMETLTEVCSPMYWLPFLLITDSNASSFFEKQIHHLKNTRELIHK